MGRQVDVHEAGKPPQLITCLATWVRSRHVITTLAIHHICSRNDTADLKEIMVIRQSSRSTLGTCRLSRRFTCLLKRETRQLITTSSISNKMRLLVKFARTLMCLITGVYLLYPSRFLVPARQLSDYRMLFRVERY